jgi:hypothetical protein
LLFTVMAPLIPLTNILSPLFCSPSPYPSSTTSGKGRENKKGHRDLKNL